MTRWSVRSRARVEGKVGEDFCPLPGICIPTFDDNPAPPRTPHGFALGRRWTRTTTGGGAEPLLVPCSSSDVRLGALRVPVLCRKEVSMLARV